MTQRRELARRRSSFGSDGQIRFIGPYDYLYHPGGPALPGGKTWVRAPSPQQWEPVTAGQGLSLAAGLSSLAVTSPQNLFALLKTASTVDRQGSASGDGWTGTSYAFTARITFDPDGSSQPAVTAAGTVAVDQQGRVRRLDVAYTLASAGIPAARAGDRRDDVRRFRDAGVGLAPAGQRGLHPGRHRIPARPHLTSTNHPSDTGGGPPRRSRSRCTPGHAGNPVHPTPQRETDMRIKNGSRHNQ